MRLPFARGAGSARWARDGGASPGIDRLLFRGGSVGRHDESGELDRASEVVVVPRPAPDRVDPARERPRAVGWDRELVRAVAVVVAERAADRDERVAIVGVADAPVRAAELDGERALVDEARLDHA